MMSSIRCSKYTLLNITIAVLIIQSVSSFDCSPSYRKIECECCATMAECFGIQTSVSEIQEVLANISFASNLILKIDGLQFDDNFMFENGSNIKFLTLGYGFQTLAPNIFSGLSLSLVSLNLQNNSMREIGVIFSSLYNLEDLYLDLNKIKELKSSEFINLSNLKRLSISRNNIHEVSPDVFQNLTSLQELVLSYNNISILENINLTSSSLTILKLDNCFIEGSLYKDAFSYLPNLEQLDLCYNNLSEIAPYSLSGLKNLKFLNVSYNVIKKLDEYAFSELTSLTFLDLQENQIQIFSVTSFAKLQNLIYLDLSRNKLNSVLCEYTTDFASLEEIYLRDNEIKSFTSGAFFYSPNLTVLDIAGNNLECSCSLTDTALYLIKNSTIESKDLESISCIIPSTLSSERITDYKNSRCTTPEPCKNSNKLYIEEDEYEDDYSDEKNVSSSTFTVHVTTPLFTDLSISENPAVTISKEVTTEAVYRSEKLLTETSASSEITTRTTQSSSTIQHTTIGTNSTSIPKCFTVSLSVTNISSGSEMEILKSFTYDGDTFCLKWTVGNISTIKRCIIRYTNNNGINIKNLKCPTINNEVIEWSVATNIYNFCIIIFTSKKVDSCTELSKKSMSVSSTLTTVPLATSQKSSKIEYSTTTISTTVNLSTPFESSITTINPETAETVFKVVTSSTTSEKFISTTMNKMSKSSESSIGTFSPTAETITAEDTEEKTFFSPNISTTGIPNTRSMGFSVTALNLYYNNSELVFITWVVNSQQPFPACNLTLISTTQQFDFPEGIFPCKNNTYRLRNVGENDLFKICIESQHEVNGKNRICKQSPSIAKASRSKEDSSLNSSMIPLICLLILFGILVMYITLKNIFKKKKESYKYDVHAEEEKYQQRTKTRLSSSHDESVRFSYIVKEII